MKLEAQVQGKWISWEPILQKEKTLSIRIWNGDVLSLSQEKRGLRWLKGNENGAVIDDDFGKTTGNWSWIVWVPEKAMAPHSNTLAWKIPWMEEHGRLQSMGSLRVGHDWATSLSFFTFMHWRRKQQPTPVCLPGESQGRGAWWAAIYGVARSRRRLKRLSSSSSSSVGPGWTHNDNNIEFYFKCVQGTILSVFYFNWWVKKGCLFCLHFKRLPRSVVFNRQWFCPPGDVWQCLDTFFNCLQLDEY